jgi:hypothetical protein
MILRQHLTTKSNDITLKDISFATEHQEHNGVITHVGWKIKATYGGSDPKKHKQAYELIFSPEEAQMLLDKLQAMQDRFTDEFVSSALTQRAADTHVDDD